jgi:subtilase family serine protease
MSRAMAFAGTAALTAAVFGMNIAGGSRPAEALSTPADTVMASTTVPFASHSRVTGDVAGTQRISIQVWLRPRVAAAEKFDVAVSTPGSTLFHHYLRPRAYSARFGATSNEADTTESWLRRAGFTGVQADSRRSYVRATAPVSTINTAFHTQLEQYQRSSQAGAGSYALRANDRALSVPASLAGSMVGVTGLDNAAPIIPIAGAASTAGSPAASPAASAAASPDACSQYYGQNTISGLPEQFGTTTFPTSVCGYSARQIRAAYGANWKNTGKGQTIALVELGQAPDMFLDLQDYAAANKMPAPSSQRYTELNLGPGGACGDPFATEEPLDIQASYDIAPRANQLVVDGDACNNGDFGVQGILDADTTVLGGTAAGSQPLATIVSNSWESGDEDQPAALTDVEHDILVQAVAEGVGMYFSSGDDSGVAAPSDDPDATAVGGTTLGIGQAGQRLFETGWSTAESTVAQGQWTAASQPGAAGGGASLVWAEPSYQQGVVPPDLSSVPGDRGGPGRSTPDISADGDRTTGFAVGQLAVSPADPSAPPTFFESTFAGTSLASPIVAGMVAAAQQGQAAPFGFANPLLYQLAGTTAVHDILPLTSDTPALFRGALCAVNAEKCTTEALETYDDQDPAFFDEGYTGQVTRSGYDNMTGIGTPNGQKFITALRELAR